MYPDLAGGLGKSASENPMARVPVLLVTSSAPYRPIRSVRDRDSTCHFRVRLWNAMARLSSAFTATRVATRRLVTRSFGGTRTPAAMMKLSRSTVTRLATANGDRFTVFRAARFPGSTVPGLCQ